MNRIYEADTFFDCSCSGEGKSGVAPQAFAGKKVIEVETVVLDGIEEKCVAPKKAAACSDANAKSEEAPQVLEAKPAEGELVELSVYYPPRLCNDPKGKTVKICVPLVLLERGNIASVLPKHLPDEPKEEAAQPPIPAEEPIPAEAPAPVEAPVVEAPAEESVEEPAREEAAEPLSLVQAAEEIIEESEPEKVLMPAVATEEAAASAERASELSAIVPLEYVSPELEANPFDGIKSRTFEEKLADLPEAMRRRYDALNAYLATYERMRVVAGKKYRTYKSGNTAFVKMAIRGKTLSAYFALDPKEYENTKYIFTNEGESAAFENYPMRLRLSSDRQERWARELVDAIAEKNEISKLPEDVMAELAVEAESEAGAFDPFAALKRKKQKTFKQKLRAGTAELRARYKAIKAMLSEIDRVRIIESNKGETYKRGSTPIAKLTVKGKTLNAYLALPPSEFAETKYKFLDASEIKAYEKYPMRVKISSDRQEKWAKELVDEIVARQNLKKK